MDVFVRVADAFQGIAHAAAPGTELRFSIEEGSAAVAARPAAAAGQLASNVFSNSAVAAFFLPWKIPCGTLSPVTAETYVIRSVECNATDYIDLGDTQFAVYTGDCEVLVPFACNEDAPDVDLDNGPYPAELTLTTEMGVVYRMLVDGFDGSNGEFCLEVTRSTMLP